MNYGFVIDNGKCIGCHACSTACKSENQVPVGVHRTWVKYVEAGKYPDVKRHFQVTRCNHCANPPCVRICPVTAMYQRDDGIVEFDSDACIGCKGCMQACPYDAIYLDPETHTAAKCHLCSHRLDVGLEPACVVVCPEHAILAGDLDDPASEVSRTLARSNAVVRKPEQGTSPKVFYIEGAEVVLHPGAAQRASQTMFGDVLDDPHYIGDVGTSAASARQTYDHSRTTARVPDTQGLPSAGPLNIGGRMAEHMVQEAHNVQHKVQWHWQIPSYLVTKHGAAGVFALLAVLALWPGVPWQPGVMFAGGLVGILLSVLTTLLLLLDLDRPDRFFYLLVRPNWKSWIARAAWILMSFSAVTGLWWGVEAAGLFGLLGAGLVGTLRPLFALLTLPLAWLAATYTAFLFAQAEGRDMWQAPHVPAVMTTQAVGLSGAILASMGVFIEVSPEWVSVLRWAGSMGLLASAAMTLLGDYAVPQSSEIARRAARDMTHGRFALSWWGGLALVGFSPSMLAYPSPVMALGAVFLASTGIFLWAWAFVMAPQRIPNS